MSVGIGFVLNSAMLGFGLAMDAFSVSVANGLGHPDLPRRWRIMIPATFAGFQFLMPMTGWFCVRAIAETFEAFRRAVPWVAFTLLFMIGGKMLFEGLLCGGDGEQLPLSVPVLIMQGVATSVDALSVGFTLAGCRFTEALVSSSVIAVVTFLLCACGLSMGQHIGSRFTGHTSALGGMILMIIGLRLLVMRG